MGDYSFGHSMYGFVLPEEGEAFLQKLEALPGAVLEWKVCWPEPAPGEDARSAWSRGQSALVYCHWGTGPPSGVFVNLPIRSGNVLAQFVVSTWKGPKAIVDPDFSTARKALRSVAKLSNKNVEAVSADRSSRRPVNRCWVSNGVRELQATDPELVLREDLHRAQGTTFEALPIR